MRRVLVAALLLVAPAPALADRALLIASGDYPALGADLRLAAPDEDAARLGAALVRAGLPAASVTMMTDRAGTAPTRDAVLAALGRLAAEVAKGEQVLIYFSGHGAQAPAADPRAEPDGLDEIYLMRDAAGWDGGVGRVAGSISDRELMAAIGRIRARGADVWFVADTCHAAGLTRAGTSAEVRVKGVTAAALGIPTGARVKRLPARRTQEPQPAGRFAAFYAAGPGALALERRLPLGSPDARTLSQFSYALTRAIDAGRLRSLRDLAIALNAADQSLGGGAPQPIYEGALDLPVLGLAADRLRRFMVERDGGRLRLAAGQEEGIAPGARFRLIDAEGRDAGGAAAAEVGLGATTLVAERAPPPGMIEAEPVAPPLAIAGDARLLAAAEPIAGRGAARSITAEARLWHPGARPACPALTADGPPAAESRPMDLLAPPTLGQCDVVVAAFRNAGAAAVDLSPFYVDAAGRLAALSFVDGDGVRVGPGESRSVAVRLLSEDAAGRRLAVGSERLLLVALPAEGRIPADLRGAAAPHMFRSATPQQVASEGAGALVYRWQVR